MKCCNMLGHAGSKTLEVAEGANFGFVFKSMTGKLQGVLASVVAFIAIKYFRTLVVPVVIMHL